MARYDETYVTFDYDALWSEFEGVEKNIVCLSDRDISIILSALRVASWPSRWFGSDRYNLRKSGRLADLETGLSYIERLESNLMSSCGEDIRAGLEAIAGAILNKVCCGSGAASGSVGGAGTGGAGATGVQPVEPVELEVGDPPAGYATWAAYHADVCDKAWWLVNTISDDLGRMSTLQFAGATAISILPLLAAMLLDPIPGDELFLLAGLLITIAFYGATTLNQIRSSLEDCKAEMVCALYSADGPEAGKEAAIEVFRTQIESDTSDMVVVEYGVQCMNLMLSWNGLNQVYEYQAERTYPDGDSDCTECVDNPCDITLEPYYGLETVTTVYLGDDQYQVTVDCVAQPGIGGQTYGGFSITGVDLGDPCYCGHVESIELVSGSLGAFGMNRVECNGQYVGWSSPLGDLAGLNVHAFGTNSTGGNVTWRVVITIPSA